MSESWRPLDAEAALAVVLSLPLIEIVKLRDRLDAVMRGNEPPPDIAVREPRPSAPPSLSAAVAEQPSAEQQEGERVSKRPERALHLTRRIDADDVRRIRAREQFVPGFTDDDDPTHLTTGFLKMTALCGHYPVEYCGDSPSGEWCEACVDEAERRAAGEPG